MKKQKNRGITLVALIITIIVMLILVAVTVTIVVDSDIIGQAEQAGELYKNAYANEGEKVSDETIEGEGLRHNTIEGYIQDLSTEAYATYAVGDIIELKNTRGEEDDIEEEFYVIKDEGDTVVLLSKYNIKEDDGNWMQDTTGASNPMQFSSTNYWSSATITNNSLDLNKYTPADPTQIKDTDAIEVAKQYASQIDKATSENGRLMTLEEIEELDGSREKWSTSGCPTWINSVKNANGEDKYMYFWLGSAYGTGDVWDVLGEGGGLSNYFYDNVDNCGVRPVIEISKSLI